jgi:hypothetical protein
MEGKLHELLKNSVSTELKKEGYEVFTEPLESPHDRLLWQSFRPDLLGISLDDSESTIVIVECETKPNIQRINEKLKKIRNYMHYQARLNEDLSFRLLLVIPFGTLKRLNREIRKIWRVWIVSEKGKILHKIN